MTRLEQKPEETFQYPFISLEDVGRQKKTRCETSGEPLLASLSRLVEVHFRPAGKGGFTPLVSSQKLLSGKLSCSRKAPALCRTPFLFPYVFEFI
jgi:hypothetical protein